MWHWMEEDRDCVWPLTAKGTAWHHTHDEKALLPREHPSLHPRTPAYWYQHTPCSYMMFATLRRQYQRLASP